MRFLTKANLKAHARQYIATACAIIICCIFICIASSFGSVMRWTIGSGETQLMKNTQVVVTYGEFDEDSRAAVNGTISAEKFKADPLAAIVADRAGIRQTNGTDLELQPVYQTRVGATIGKKAVQMQGVGLFSPQFYRPPLSEGKAPTGKNQIALGESYLEKTGVGVGDTIEIQVPPSYADEDGKPTTQKVTVSGIVRRDASMYIGQVPDVYLSPDLGKRLAQANVGVNQILVHTQQDPAKLARKLGQYLNDKQLLSKDLSVVTVTQKQSETTAGQAEQIALQAVVLFFPLLAVLVCIGIVSVTFQVVLARRRRETALLRCVGATVAQVRRAAFLECLLVGIVSAVIGTLIGWLGSIALVYGTGMIGSLSQTLEVIGIFPVALSLVTGIIVPLIGALRPTFGLGKIRPIAALNTQELNKKGKPKRHIFHWILTAFLAIAGSGLWVLAWGNRGSEEGEKQLIALGAAIAGALILMCAALMICRFLLPAFTALFTRPFARKYATAKLAGENVKRDPHRTGATATALVLGVTLMATILIGTASVQKTVNDEINRRFAVDYSLVSANPTTPLPKNELKKASQVEGVSGVGKMPGIVADTITNAQGSTLTEEQLTGTSPENRPEPASTESPGENAESADTENAASTENPDGEAKTEDTEKQENTEKESLRPFSLLLVTLPENVNSLTRKRIQQPQPGEMWLVGEVEKPISQPVNLGFKGGGKITVKARTMPKTASGFPSDFSVVYGVLSQADFKQLTASGVKTQTYGVIAKFDLSRGSTDTIQTIQDFTNQFWELELANFEGSALLSSIITMVLRVMMVILLCLLGISAIVALVGVANTLSLSVVDRAQENALLRAVGATRTQIRRMLIIEGTLIGLGALVVGVALSALFSWFVMQCMPFAGIISQKNIELEIPWLWVGLVVLVTELFCFLASVLPGRRAAKASPIEALNAADQ